jgi:hypothetical protein
MAGRGDGSRSACRVGGGPRHRARRPVAGRNHGLGRHRYAHLLWLPRDGSDCRFDPRYAAVSRNGRGAGAHPVVARLDDRLDDTQGPRGACATTVLRPRCFAHRVPATARSSTSPPSCRTAPPCRARGVRRAKRACCPSLAPQPARRSTSAVTAWSPLTISNRTEQPHWLHVATPQFHSLSISEVQAVTRDAVAVCFDVPEHLHEAFSVYAGPVPDVAHRH